MQSLAVSCSFECSHSTSATYTGATHTSDFQHKKMVKVQERNFNNNYHRQRRGKLIMWLKHGIRTHKIWHPFPWSWANCFISLCLSFPLVEEHFLSLLSLFTLETLWDREIHFYICRVPNTMGVLTYLRLLCTTSKRNANYSTKYLWILCGKDFWSVSGWSLRMMYRYCLMASIGGKKKARIMSASQSALIFPPFPCE